MRTRTPISDRIVLLGESDGKPFRRTFTIQKYMHAGASMLSYIASHDRSAHGILKEFYPEDARTLTRDARQQLLCADEASAAAFARRRQTYLEPYEMLLEAKKENPDLTTFLPAVEIYSGCDPEGRPTGTAYIWAPEQECETFRQFCREVRAHPEERPEWKLEQALCAIETLVKCVAALHSACLLHRDIKPDNFGFHTRGNEMLTQYLSLFDIDSICSFYSKSRSIVGTPGYLPPEVLNGTQLRPNVKMDLYAIGCTLYEAIIVTRDEADARFRQENLYRLPELVSSSRLIRASENNAHPKLRQKLAEILYRCLCSYEDRYSSCEALLKALKEARYYTLTNELAKRTRAGEQWQLKDLEWSLDQHQHQNSQLVLTEHLFEVPLFRSLPRESSRLNVLILGLGNYAQKFLDLTLQMGQLYGRTLHVTVASEEMEADRQVYLQERPELPKFLNVDGSMAGSPEEAFGHLTFCPLTLSEEQREGEQQLRSFLRRFTGDKKPHYVFAALGDDDLSRLAAQVCHGYFEDLQACYVWCGPRPPEEREGLWPVCVCADAARKPQFPLLERMAFNCHLLWMNSRDLNVDYRAAEEDFHLRYNYNSSILSALSIQYKLWSLGIVLNDTNAEDCALAYQRKFESRDPQLQEKFDALIRLEHSRWITERVCSGWSTLRDLRLCASGATRDNRTKRHICLLRSRPERPLNSWTREQWDYAGPEALERLDELDRMSVELHRMFAAHARKARKQSLLQGSSMKTIQALIAAEPAAGAAFREWRSYLRDVRSGGQQDISRADSLEDAFLRSLEGLQPEQKDVIKKQMKAFDALFYPILAARQYTNFKEKDADILRHIPFLLTFGPLHLVVPCGLGSAAALFENLAAATVASPTALTWLYETRGSADLRQLQESLPRMAAFLKKKNLRAEAEVLVLHDFPLSESRKRILEQQLLTDCGGAVKRVQFCPVQSPEQCVQVIRSLPGSPLLEKNLTRLSRKLEKSGVYEQLDHYAFDCASMTFTASGRACRLQWIPARPVLTVSDMACLHGTGSTVGRHPEFYGEDQDLWAVARQKGGAPWSRLCGHLNAYAESHDVIGRFVSAPGEERRLRRYLLPFGCFQSAEKLLEALKTGELIGEESTVGCCTTELCEVLIAGADSQQKAFERLFSQVWPLMLPEQISIEPEPETGAVTLRFSGPSVTELAVDGEELALLRFLEERRYVIGLQERADTVCFSYAAPPIKALLTDRLACLRMYVYHRARALGCFDDIVTDWQDPATGVRFDLVLTRGFRSLFVQCGSPQPEQLAKQVAQYGIHAAAVLVTDDGMPPLQESKGVVVVWEPQALEQIGQTLADLLSTP